MKKMSKVLRKAGDVIRLRGFGKGFGSDGRSSGPLCLRGSIGLASKTDPYDDDLLGYLDMITTGIEGEIVTWNDAHDRTAEEAQIALDAAYVLALQEEGEDDLTDYEEL